MEETRFLVSKCIAVGLAALLFLCSGFPSAPADATNAEHWENVLHLPSNEGVVSILTVDQEANALYAVTTRSVLRSLDSGATWNVLSIGGRTTFNWSITDFNSCRLAIDPIEPSTLYFADGNVWRSTDAGSSWSVADVPGGAVCIAVDPSTSGTLYAAGGSAVSRSTDGGLAWVQQSQRLGLPSTDQWGRPIESTSSIAFLAVDPLNPATVYAGTRWNGLFRSDDGARTWVEVDTGLAKGITVNAMAFSSAEPSALYMTPCPPGTLYCSKDRGVSWTKRVLPGCSTVCTNPTDPSTVWAFGSKGAYCSSDGGSSWKPMPTTGMLSDTSSSMSQFGCGLAFDSSTPPIVYAGVYNDIYRWMPGGVVTTKLTLVVGSSVMTLSNNLGLVSNLHLDAAPMIGAGGRTLVPIRAIVEAIGGMAEWNATSRTVTVKLGTIILELTVGKKTARLNESAVSIDADPKVVPEIVNGRTMLPLRFVTESLGATVGWDPSTQTITITYQGA